MIKAVTSRKRSVSVHQFRDSRWDVTEQIAVGTYRLSGTGGSTGTSKSLAGASISARNRRLMSQRELTAVGKTPSTFRCGRLSDVSRRNVSMSRSAITASSSGWAGTMTTSARSRPSTALVMSGGVSMSSMSGR